MHIVVVGIDHTTAPITLREQVACSPRQVAWVLQAAQQVAREGVLLSTCNRLELYAVCSEVRGSRESLLGVLSETCEVRSADVAATCCPLTVTASAGRLLRVACGLHCSVAEQQQIPG